MPRKKLSETRSEAEEARWFEENQERLLKLFEHAEKEGSLRVGGKSICITLSKKTEALRKPPSQKVMLRIPLDDLDRARRQAARKGIGYQTYIKILLREGLDREGRVRHREWAGVLRAIRGPRTLARGHGGYQTGPVAAGLRASRGARAARR